jgi:hypothetical protein
LYLSISFPGHIVKQDGRRIGKTFDHRNLPDPIYEQLKELEKCNHLVSLHFLFSQVVFQVLLIARRLGQVNYGDQMFCQYVCRLVLQMYLLLREQKYLVILQLIQM